MGHARFLVPALTFALSCEGRNEPIPGTADPVGWAEPSATRRLTVEEWRNTVSDLLGVDVDPSLLPADELTAGFPANVASGLSELEVEDLLEAAETAAAAATVDVDLLLGCAAAERTCVEAWAGSYLERAWRRPVETTEVADLLALYDLGDTPSDGVRLAITGSLVAGSFLYRPVLADAPPTGGRVPLDDWEIASRLSYTLWRTMPDEELFAAARVGALSTSEQVVEQAARMLADPRGARAIGSFHVDWLGLGNLAAQERVATVPYDPPFLTHALADLPVVDWVASDGLGNVLLDDTFSESIGADGKTRFSTADSSTEVFLHHGVALGSTTVLTGQLHIDDPLANIGVTVLSDVPDSNAFYRLEVVDGTVALTSSGTNASCSEPAPYAFPVGREIAFEITVVVAANNVVIDARLFDDGDEAPGPYHCKDHSFSRLGSGTVGLWANGPGTKSWSKLVATSSEPVPPFDFVVAAELYMEGARSFVETWAAEGGRLEELFLADWAMANETFAPYLGVDGIVGEEFQRVTLPPERLGLLSQPLFLTAFAKVNQSSPVARGKLVREAILCGVLSPPPPDFMVVAPDTATDLTTRERFAAHVEDPVCAGCHLMMDPIGFGFESFDQVGAYRADEYGLPIDASGEIVGGGDAEGTFADLRGLLELVAASDTVRSCVASHWYRYVAGQVEDPNAPDPALGEALAACTDGGCAVADLVLPLVAADSFRFRSAHDGDAP